MNAHAAAHSQATRSGPESRAALPTGTAVTGRRAIAWWGMVLLIVSEAMIFAALLASYFSLRLNSVLWPPQGVDRPELTFSSINTAILILSSVAMQWGVGGLRRGSIGRLRLGFALALALGAVFLGVQVYEFTQLSFTPQDNAYASLFWSITGLNAVHVLVALLMNLFVQVRAAYGHFGPQRRQAVDNLALYWHFVDVVWVFIFLSLFLSTYWQ